MRSQTLVKQVFSKTRPKPAASRRPRAIVQAVQRACFETFEDRRMLSFSPATGYAVGLVPQAVATADFNGDGRLDLVTANTYGNTVSVLLGNVDGTFQAALNSAAGAHPLSVAVGDFNADGKTDLVTANESELGVMAGDGDGTFQPVGSIILPDQFPWTIYSANALQQSPTSVVVGDLNADGKLDLVATGRVSFPVFFTGPDGYGMYYESRANCFANVLLGTGNATFANAKITPEYQEVPPAVALADFNGDGKLDVVAAGYGASVMLGTGDGTLRTPLQSGYGWAGASVPVADFDRDGKPDLLLGNTILTARGDGTFQTGQTVSDIYGHAVAGDVNGDGKLDLVGLTSWTQYGSYGPGGNYDPTTTDSATVLLGYGDGSFAPASASVLDSYPGYVSYDPGTPLLGDFNGDGWPDLAATGSAKNRVAVALNNGNWPVPVLPPSMSIGDAAVTEGNSGTVDAVFTVTLSKPSDQVVTVQYATAGGTAAAGNDFNSAAGTVTFQPGETSKTVAVPVRGDLIDEYDETVFVLLSGVTNARVADGHGLGTIIDNDPPPSMVISDVTRNEGDSGRTGFTFTVSLSAPSEKSVSVNYATTNGTATTADNDFVAASGTLYFAAGQTSQTVTVMVIGDKKKESNETFFLNLSGASSAVITDGQGIGTVLSDDVQGKSSARNNK